MSSQIVGCQGVVHLRVPAPRFFRGGPAKEGACKQGRTEGGGAPGALAPGETIRGRKIGDFLLGTSVCLA